MVTLAWPFIPLSPPPPPPTFHHCQHSTMLAVVSTTIDTPHQHASQCNGQRCKQGSEQVECPCHVCGRALGKVSSHPSSLPPTSLTLFAEDDGAHQIANKPSAHAMYGEWATPWMMTMTPPNHDTTPWPHHQPQMATRAQQHEQPQAPSTTTHWQHWTTMCDNNNMWRQATHKERWPTKWQAMRKRHTKRRQHTTGRQHVKSRKHGKRRQHVMTTGCQWTRSQPCHACTATSPSPSTPCPSSAPHHTLPSPSVPAPLFPSPSLLIRPSSLHHSPTLPYHPSALPPPSTTPFPFFLTM